MTMCASHAKTNLAAKSRKHKTARLKIRYVPIASLKLNPGNPRVHTEKQIKQIARSIEAFGFNVPVLINRQREVIAGHGRVLAARSEGLAQVPTITLEHLTDGQARAFLIADNKLNENSRWNKRLLAEQLKRLLEVELDFDIDVTGFELGEIEMLIEGLDLSIDGKSDPADTVPETGDAVQASRPGSLPLIRRQRIFCWQCLSSPRLR
jgi:ParB-like chromosome segregation protein Spo0J